MAHGGGTQAGTRQHRTPFSPTFDLLLALPGHRVVEAVVAECCVASLFSSLWFNLRSQGSGHELCRVDVGDCASASNTSLPSHLPSAARARLHAFINVFLLQFRLFSVRAVRSGVPCSGGDCVSVWERVCVECQAQETHNHSPSRHINTSNTHPHVHRFVQLIKGVLNRVLAPVSRCAVGMRALLPPSLSVAHPNVTSLQCRLTLSPRCGLLPFPSHTRTRAVHASETGAGTDQLQANGRWACVDWRPRPRGGPRGESHQLKLCTFSHSHCVVVSSLRIFHCPRPVLFGMSPA